MKNYLNFSTYNLKLNLIHNKYDILLFENMKSQGIADYNIVDFDPILCKKYQYVDILGEGCFGKVLKVISRTTMSPRALKIEKNRQQKNKMVLKN
jgi:hypothetical protein